MATTTFTPPMLRGAGTRGIPEIPAGSSFTNNFSLNFDGTDDEVTFSNIVASDEFTVSLWLKPTAFNNNSKSYVFGINNNNSNFLKLQSATSIQLYINYSFRTLSNGGSGNDIVLNQWQNLILIRNSSNVLTAYLNGVAWSSSATVSSTLTINSIGRIINTSFGYAGGIDEFAVFNTDQSSNVSSIYNSGVPNDLSSLSPLTWYRFEEGSGTTAIDSGTGGNNGTISGATYSTDVPT